jgi:hypothetical protein
MSVLCPDDARARARARVCVCGDKDSKIKFTISGVHLSLAKQDKFNEAII